MTMHNGYTDEVNVQILIALMKHHNVRRIIASPGTTNITLVNSLQHDPFFTIYSAAEERSAAYMACGIAAETGEPVALTCTGATASRNYMPGLTEAYYRKLPVLAITSSQHLSHAHNLYPQMLDRFRLPNDVCKISVQCPAVHTDEDRIACETSLNTALLELNHSGMGPVHVNLVTSYSPNFNVPKLPAVRYIDRINSNDALPPLMDKRVAIYVGAHNEWSAEERELVNRFCSLYNAVVIGDHTSNYAGPFWADSPLLLKQEQYNPPCKKVDVMIHLGQISGSYAWPSATEVWRVDPDGTPKDAFGKLRYIFNMEEEAFFKGYVQKANGQNQDNTTFLEEWKREDSELRSAIPELPFSNIWCAQHTAPLLPDDSVLHLGILNSLRSWNFFPVRPSVRCYANTGGFGIDGCISSLIGASCVTPNKIFFGVVGDLACFYDLSSLGNRNVQSNMRLMVINNGVGTEFKNYNHMAYALGQDADEFIAARGHYGNKSHELLKHYSEDLGFEYLTASDKQEFLENVKRFTTTEKTDRPMLFEVFTNSDEESNALRIMSNLKTDSNHAAKSAVKSLIGPRGVNAIKRILGK